jgi:hypothetical protein
LLPNRQFRAELLARVLREIGVIRGQNGAPIGVEEFSARVAAPSRLRFTQEPLECGEVVKNL